MKYMHEKVRETVENRRIWAQIDLDALVNNYVVSRDYMRTLHPGVPVMAVIKANAYGHGAGPCARALYGSGCRYFAVASLEEGIVLRKSLADLATERVEILLLGRTDPACASLLHQYGLTQTLYSKEYAAELHASAKQADVMLDVHVKVDTGMHRIGYPAYTAALAEQTVREIGALADTCDAFCVKGMFTHLSDADGGSFCREQWHRFCTVKQGLEQLGKCPAFCHVCNSSGSMRYPDTYLSGVRLGALLFGVAPLDLPSREREDGSNLFPVERLRPVMRLQTRIIHLHRVAAGEPVGYGALYRSDRDRVIATLSAGYADGWLRAYADTRVIVHTAKGDVSAPTVGRICMDLCMIDVTDLPCEIGDVVTLFGQDLPSLAALAEHAGTIAYEIPCLVTARVPRVYSES